MRFRHAYSGANLLQQFLLPLIIKKFEKIKYLNSQKACKGNNKLPHIKIFADF
jgi:hypothetical protein